MAYDEKLAARIRKLIAGDERMTERKMFGGIAFMLNGNMFCGVIKDDLMVRVGPDAHEDALAKSYARPMDFANRPMKGMIYVSPEGVAGRGLKTCDRSLKPGSLPPSASPHRFCAGSWRPKRIGASTMRGGRPYVTDIATPFSDSFVISVRTASAIVAGSIRGMLFRNPSRAAISSVVRLRSTCRTIGVSTTPGQTQFTRIFASACR